MIGKWKFILRISICNPYGILVAVNFFGYQYFIPNGIFKIKVNLHLD